MFPIFHSVQAGFPSPGSDIPENHIDLNIELIKHPSATYFVRVRGDSMRGKGIFDNDVLVVDRSLDPTNNKVVIAMIDGEFTVKTYKKNNNQITLLPANSNYNSIIVTSDMDFEIWGVVVYSIHEL